MAGVAHRERAPPRRAAAALADARSDAATPWARITGSAGSSPRRASAATSSSAPWRQHRLEARGDARVQRRARSGARNSPRHSPGRERRRLARALKGAQRLARRLERPRARARCAADRSGAAAPPWRDRARRAGRASSGVAAPSASARTCSRTAFGHCGNVGEALGQRAEIEPGAADENERAGALGPAAPAPRRASARPRN